MKTIWKYTLNANDLQQISMPAGAKVLSVGNQQGTICIWAEVDTEAPQENRNFALVGTGNPIPECVDLTLLGRATILDGRLVFHVFEVTAK